MLLTPWNRRTRAPFVFTKRHHHPLYRIWDLSLISWLLQPKSNHSCNFLSPPLPNPRCELMVVLANVDHLVVLRPEAHPHRGADPEHSTRSSIVLNEEEAEDNIWVQAVAKTPAQVAAEHANVPDGTQQWWIVYVGQEPGIYSTLEMATAQTNKCPNQQWRSRKGGKHEALDFYRARYDANEVVKWVELNP
ncbi:hypothetical protein B0H14DRAFT_3447367 [Mycena olivaceomarginata]|nr:hypothetical protein B0H14DRAFT_3447367 [Mycena olivaceomarginata]